MRTVLSLAIAFTAVFLMCCGVDALPPPSPSCTHSLRQRKEWRDLTTLQKQKYINAVLCIQGLPSQTGSEARSRYDDFQWLHQQLADEIHFTGQFLPWHRLMLIAYEKELRNRCGFTGIFPYWNPARDIAATGSIKTSPIWDPQTGFGGNGSPVPGYNGPQNNNTNLPGWIYDSGGGCITDGPFVNHRQFIGPGTVNIPAGQPGHCITRSWNDNYNHLKNAAAIATVQSQSDYVSFNEAISPFVFVNTETGLGPHGATHISIGGTAQDIYASPGEPLFYLLHSNIDRVWWQWQKKNNYQNLYDIGGRFYVTPNPPETQLTSVMRMLGITPDVRIARLMDARNAFLCYEYV